jgi:hypothetical protein
VIDWVVFLESAYELFEEMLFFLQYAFYFLVVGAAIWASSWAG